MRSAEKMNGENDCSRRPSHASLGALLLIAAILFGRVTVTQGGVPEFFQIEEPAYLGARLFSGTFVSEDYGQIQEGFELEQSVNRHFGLFARFSGFQVYANQSKVGPFLAHDRDNDLFALITVPIPGQDLYFGRLQGGLDFSLAPSTFLMISGGRDVGSDSSALIEGDFSSWLFSHSLHPLNFSFSSIYTFQDGASSSSIDFQTVVHSTGKWLVTSGVGGAIFSGGFISGVSSETALNEFERLPFRVTVANSTAGLGGQGGLDLGLFYRPGGVTLSMQSGYGSSGVYGEVGVTKEIYFPE